MIDERWVPDGRANTPRPVRNDAILAALRAGAAPVVVARHYGISRQRVFQIKRAAERRRTRADT